MRQLVVVPVGDALVLDANSMATSVSRQAARASLVGELQPVLDLARHLVHVAFARQRLEQAAVLHALQVGIGRIQELRY